MDLLLSTYGNIDYIMNMDIADGWRLINKAKERQDECRMWLLYVNVYPNFNKDNFVKFEDFYNKKQATVCTKTTEEILNEAKEIRKKIKGKGK